MQRVHVIQDFPQPVSELFAYLSEQENLEPLFGAKIKRLSDGDDGSRNGKGASRELRVGPLPGFVETNTEVISEQLIRYRITRGGILKNHEGVMRFSSQGDGGSLLDYTIEFDGKLPLIGPIVKRMLTKSIKDGLRRYAAQGRERAAA
jgi:hypothetical protein